MGNETINAAKIETGEQAFEFLKNYNKTFFKGKLGAGIKIDANLSPGKKGAGERESIVEENKKLSEALKTATDQQAIDIKNDLFLNNQGVVNNFVNDKFKSGLGITREEFNVGEEICMIRHCNHKFKKEPLYQWFNSNEKCPVCRFDIRDYVEDDNIDVSLDLSSNIDISGITSVDALSDALRDAITRVDPDNIVSLELPIPINRTNSGTLSDFFRDLSNNVI